MEQLGATWLDQIRKKAFGKLKKFMPVTMQKREAARRAEYGEIIQKAAIKAEQDKRNAWIAGGAAAAVVVAVLVFRRKR